MHKRRILIGCLCLVAAVVVALPSKAQSLSEQMSMEEARDQCSLILLPEHCDRLVALGRKSLVALAEALAILLTEGLAEANAEMDRLLDELEQGHPIKNERAKKEGFEI